MKILPAVKDDTDLLVKMKVLPGLGFRVILGERVGCFSCVVDATDNGRGMRYVQKIFDV